MNNLLLRNSLRFILLIVLQIFVFNKVYLGGYLNPYVYLLFVILLPLETPWWLLLISSFSMGLFIDIFCGSLGIHTAATTFVAYFRPTIIRFMIPKLEKGSNETPNINFMGIPLFSVYVLIMVFLHSFVLFYLEVFRFAELGTVFMRVLLSTLLSSGLIILLTMIFKSKTK